ncbi:MAG: hypothetical protein LBP26_07525 [Clostridiales bacterium]|jgi:cytosine/adenosine deaminase-related metal-dependent hydrolase|nr:hypothetical protein [Clostridiales bacterium]
MFNAFTTVTDLSAFARAGIKKVRVAAASRDLITGAFSGEIEFFRTVADNAPNAFEGDIFLPSLEFSDKTVDACIEHVLGKRVRFMVRAACTLEEVGRFDAKLSLSPVMLLRRLGLLQNAIVVGGVYLDNDDVDLMVQEGASLVLTPTFNAGRGDGAANVSSYLKRGLKIALGTADNSFNKSGSIAYEADVLQLLTNAAMNDPAALTPAQKLALCSLS